MNALCAAGLLLAVVACDCSSRPGAPGDPVMIEFRVRSALVGDGTPLTISRGGAAPVRVIARDAKNQIVSGLRPTIRSRDRAVAPVDTFTRVFGRETGATYVVAWIPTP